MAARSRRSGPQRKTTPELTSYGPPEWRKPWSRTADLGEHFAIPHVCGWTRTQLFFGYLVGYPGYNPPRSGHDAEDMSETLVKNGFKGRSLLNAAGVRVRITPHPIYLTTDTFQ